jgi:hypothetical protein
MKATGPVVILLCLLLVGAVFGPSLPLLHDHLLGVEYVDHYGTQWFYWFVEHQLETGQGMGHTDLYFHPWGKDIFLHTGVNVLDGYLALPFRRILGPTLGYNLFVLLGLSSAGLAFWFLAREFTEDRWIALLSSVLFALSPFVLFELVEGRPTQAVLTLPVLFLLFVFRSGSRPGLLAPVLAGLFLALTGYQYWFYAFFGGMVCAAHGLHRIWRPPEDSGGRWRQLGRHALIAAVALVITAPVGVPLVTLAAEAGNVPGLLDVDRWGLFASPPITAEDQTIGLFLWQPLRRFAGFYVIEAGPQERLLSQAILVPLCSFVALAALIWRPGKLPRGALVAMILMAGLLAMGPIFIVHKTVLPNPVFLVLVKSIGFLKRLWWPARAASYLAILLGLAVVALLAWAKARGPRFQLVVASGLTIGWGVELIQSDVLPYPAWNDAIPAGYRCLAHGPPGAIMELPYSWTQAHLYYQTAHARPIMGGMLENNPVFTPAEFTELCDENAFVSELFAAAKLNRVDPQWPEADAQAIHDLGYRYVVAQKDAFFHDGRAPGMVDNVMRLRMRNLRKTLRKTLGKPVYEDARVAIYSPWGAPPPCGPGDVEPDTVTLGLTEVSADQRVMRTPESQLIHRPWIDKAAYVLSEEDPALELERVSTQVIPGGAGSGPPEQAEGGSPGLAPSLPPPLDQAPGRRHQQIPDAQKR